MKFFSFAAIKEHADCIALAKSLYGCTITNGRCAAAWRGGDNTEAVNIERDKFYDHVSKSGGGPIELVAYKFNGDKQRAQEYLGELYSLTPRMQTGPQPAPECRYTRLLREGYIEKARYQYRDLSGTVRHITVRLEHPDRPGKEFVQGHPDERGNIIWNIKGVETILYRLPEITAAPWAIICEGEKSADRLAALGLPATTSPMGAGKWSDSYTDALRGKSVAIAPDNDAPGREHAETVARALYGKAASVRIVGPLSTREKGGIDDWLDEGTRPRGADDVTAAVAAVPEWAPAIIAGSGPTPAQLREAKTANSTPYRNYIPRETEKEARGGRKTKEIIKEPRTHEAMLADLFRRFLGFPRRVGENWIFDHDRDSDSIQQIHGADELISWISRRSKHNAEFARGDALVTSRELLASIEATSTRYESISETPDWPRREDVYYSHGPIPPPCPNRSRLEHFVDFFLPASPEDRFLILALACAPLWYIPGIDRPAWVIDSRDGQGSGKTNLAELIAELYGQAPIATSPQEIGQRMDVLVKRMVSQSGRKARILLVDNVTGNFQSPELADLITRKDISGIPPYGRDEEVRPNNLTVVITANTATVGSDIADRSIYIHVKKPEQSMDRATWKKSVMAYIKDHRLEIIADVIGLLSAHAPFSIPTRTRFSPWETAILQPCCGTVDDYTATLDYITASREESNVEQDQARAITEHFDSMIQRTLRTEISRPVFLRTEVVNSWGRTALNDAMGGEFRGRPIQLIRNLAKTGLLPKADRELKRWPSCSTANRVSGLAWGFSDSTERATIIARNGDGEISTSEA